MKNISNWKNVKVKIYLMCICACVRVYVYVCVCVFVLYELFKLKNLVELVLVGEW